MRINPETIEKVRLAADIVEVVGDVVRLRRKGKDWSACCPFHDEKTPSFSVSPSKGIYKCFGCGAAGDVIKFVMETDKLSYPEAIRKLALRYNIEIEQEQAPTDEQLLEQNERESIFIALKHAKDFYVTQLNEDAQGRSLALTYLQERGFSATAMQAFELGYSPAGPAALLTQMRNLFSTEILLKAGLILESDNGGLLDRFRGRVMFPIHDMSGRVIGFGARIIGQAQKQAKYLNSPETPVYHKSEALYGIWQARQAIRRQDLCLLTEGYTDVVSLHQAGIEHVVASSGTSLTVGQIRLIRRFSENVTVLYDGDAAGIKASLRSIDLILEQGLNVRAVVFPDNQDPDSYLRKVGAEAFSTYISQNTKDFISFKAGIFAAEASDDPFKKAQVIKDIVESISLMPDPIKRSVMFGQSARLLGVDEQTLILESNKIINQKNRKSNEQSQPTQVKQADNQSIFENIVSDSSNEYGLETDAVIQTGSVRQKQLENVEKEICRFLILYYSLPGPGSVCLGEWMFEQLGAYKSVEQGLYSRLLDGIEAQLRQNRFEPGCRFGFDILPEPEREQLTKIAIGLSIDRHTLSENWISKMQIYTSNDSENPHLAAQQLLNRLWLSDALIKQEHQLHQLKQAQELGDEQMVEMVFAQITAHNQLIRKLGVLAGRVAG